jgi:recombination protein RecA
MAVSLDIINKSGAWFSYKETRLGQGRDNVKIYMQENPAFAEEIAALVMENKDRLVMGKKGVTIKDAPVPAPAPVEAEAPVAPPPAAKPVDIEVDD